MTTVEEIKHVEKIFKIDFVQNIGDDPRLLYADTDSEYNGFKIPFNKFENDTRTVKYSQKLSMDCNIKYKDICNTVFKNRANIAPEWNFMNFKSEVVAYRGFFNTKKFYALAKIWMEETFYKELEIKKTGGQILKADTSKITFEFLSEIYNTIVLRTEFETLGEIKRFIYIDLKNKYLTKLKDAILNFDFNYFLIPKKWPTMEKKTIPVHVKGAMFYNTVFDNSIRPGDSISLVPVILNVNKAYIYCNEIKKDKYQLPMDLLNNSINVISFPSDLIFNEDEIINTRNKLHELDIRIDFDRIIDFNITKKLAVFDKLFPPGV